jgi:hypothetical protein
MDDRRLPVRALHPRIIRTNEFSRLGKSLLASAYERIVPIARVALFVGPRPSATDRLDARQPPARKVGA